MTVSDAKASALSDLSLALGRKVDPNNYRSMHDDPTWTERVETILAKLPLKDIESLRFLIETGPIARPDS